MGQFGVVWGHLASILGRFEGVLGHLGGFFGTLGRSWVPIGRLLEHLGDPWVDFCRFRLNKAERRVRTWPIWGPKMEPKIDPKPTKIEDKNNEENESLSKTVLERSWGHLGPILGHSDLQNRALA